jgi:HIRAN domain
MECWIEQPQVPQQLLLVWQAPPDVRDRLRWAVGRLSSDADRTSFVYLEGEEFQALNLGRSEGQLEACGFSGYPAFDRMRRPEAGFWHDALETLLRRVPPRRRSDFGAYLEHHRVKAAAILSPLALLAVTEAHLPSDGFSLIDPLDASAAAVDFVFEIAGFRHAARPIAPLQDGETLTLVPEPGNRWDPSAIKVMAGEVRIGYVNRLQAATIQQWLSTRDVQCCIARLNGQPNAPRAYALARVRPMPSAMAA